MASLAELAAERTDLGDDEIDHLKRLARVWTLLADLSFADLVLYVPTETGLVAIGHVRANTGQTLYRDDLVAQAAPRHLAPSLARALDDGVSVQTRAPLGESAAPVDVTCIPVRVAGAVVAVVTAERRPLPGRESGELERTYLGLFDRFAAMIEAGVYPFPTDEADQYRLPRLGDGAIVLDENEVITYGSPNAVSALHRLGYHGPSTGVTLDAIGVDPHLVQRAFSRRLPVTIEVQRGSELTVLCRCIPLIAHDRVDGALVVLRDISEVRSRDLLLLSKDATIREIHHRVKNNLQTVSSLLQLQIRRLSSDEAKNAVRESARRIASIAVVHDLLAQAPDEEVPFAEVLRPLLRLVEDGLTSPERPVAFAVTGTIGTLPDEMATPLAVVITELVQNAVDHAFPGSLEGAPRVVIDLQADRKQVRIVVEDNGVGVAAGKDLDDLGGLGLTIVRTLIEVDLGGSVTLERIGADGGTRFVVRVPIVARTAGVLVEG